MGNEGTTLWLIISNTGRGRHYATTYKSISYILPIPSGYQLRKHLCSLVVVIIWVCIVVLVMR